MIQKYINNMTGGKKVTKEFDPVSLEIKTYPLPLRSTWFLGSERENSDSE